MTAVRTPPLPGRSEETDSTTSLTAPRPPSTPSYPDAAAEPLRRERRRL